MVKPALLVPAETARMWDATGSMTFLVFLTKSRLALPHKGDAPMSSDVAVDAEALRGRGPEKGSRLAV